MIRNWWFPYSKGAPVKSYIPNCYLVVVFKAQSSWVECAYIVLNCMSCKKVTCSNLFFKFRNRWVSNVKGTRSYILISYWSSDTLDWFGWFLFVSKYFKLFLKYLLTNWSFTEKVTSWHFSLKFTELIFIVFTMDTSSTKSSFSVLHSRYFYKINNLLITNHFSINKIYHQWLITKIVVFMESD